jgi:putative AlgH/UPF0301 family transcriptional regulator
MYKNKLLIASPLITDPVFAGSAIFILEDNKKGSNGVIVNSEAVGAVGFGDMQDLFNASPGNFDEVKKLILEGKLQSVPLFSGGPCSTPGIIFIHGHEELLRIHEEEESEYDLGIPTSFNVFDEDQPAYQDNNIPSSSASSIDKMKIIDGMYFGSPYTFGNLVQSGKLNESRFKFFSGLSAWGSGQLDYEVKNGAWIVPDFQPGKISDLFFYPEKIKEITKAALAFVKTVEKLEESKKYPWMPTVSNDFDSTWN